MEGAILPLSGWWASSPRRQCPCFLGVVSIHLRIGHRRSGSEEGWERQDQHCVLRESFHFVLTDCGLLGLPASDPLAGAP